MTLAYLSLGANLGDPVSAINQAIRRLDDHPEIRVTRQSGRYRTAPVGPISQDDFVNTAVEIESSLAPDALLTVCKSIELDIGRIPGTHWGPRIIDIDLLMVGDLTIRTDKLVLPHPEMWLRAFVLAPLSELRPDLQAPSGESIGVLRDRLARVQRIEPMSRESISSPGG